MTMQDLTPSTSVNPLAFSERFLDHCVENMHEATRHQQNQQLLLPYYAGGGNKVWSFPINETHILQIYRSGTTILRARLLIIDTSGNTLSVAADTSIVSSGGNSPEIFSQDPDNPERVLIFLSNKTILFVVDPDTDSFSHSIDSTNLTDESSSSRRLGVAWQGDDVVIISDYDTGVNLNAEALLFNIVGTTLTYHSTTFITVQTSVTVSGQGRAVDVTFDADLGVWIYTLVSDYYSIMVEFTFTSTAVTFIDSGYSTAIKTTTGCGSMMRARGRSRSVAYASSSTLQQMTFRLNSGALEEIDTQSQSNIGGLVQQPLDYVSSINSGGTVLPAENKRDIMRSNVLSSSVLKMQHAHGIHTIKLGAQPSYSLLHLCWNSTYSHLVVMHGYQSGTTFYWYHDLYAGPGQLED